MKTKESVKQLMRLPLHIVQQITGSKRRDKSALVADFVMFNTVVHGIHFVQAEIDDNYIRIEWRGHKLGGIDATRGKQDFTTHDMESHWSNDWENFFNILKDSMYTLDEQLAEQAQSDYEDSTDQSLTDAQRQLLSAHGTVGERMLATIADDFEVEVVNRRIEINHPESGLLVLVEHNREDGVWMAYLPTGQMYGITKTPNRHLREYLKLIS